MEEKYITFLYNIYNISYIIKTGKILKLPEYKSNLLNKKK